MKKFYRICIVMRLIIPICCMFPWQSAEAQDSLTRKIQEQYLTNISSKANSISHLIEARTLKQLNWLTRQETKMQAKLDRIDPEKSSSVFGRSRQKMESLKAGLLQKAASATGGMTGEYNSFLDTMQASVKFLNGSGLLNGEKAKNSIAELQSKFKQSEEIENYITARKKELREQLSSYTSFTKDLDGLNSKAYYYGAQIREYKAILNDREKTEKKALELLRRSPAFQKFFDQNSELAGLFGINRSGNAIQDLEGLQTRTVVEQMVQNRLGTDPSARQAISEQLNQAAQEFDKFKDKFPFLKNSAEAPEFKPNPMKTKKTLARIKLGFNANFDRNRYMVPTMGNFAVQAAYELNGKSSAGLGIAYKLGIVTVGKLRFTSEGVGIRSFFDYSLKGVFYANGGIELNHFSGFSNLQELKHWNGFQKTVLTGITRKVRVTSKYKSTMMLAYDWLARNQAPFSSPFIVRLGITK